MRLHFVQIESARSGVFLKKKTRAANNQSIIHVSVNCSGGTWEHFSAWLPATPTVYPVRAWEQTDWHVQSAGERERCSQIVVSSITVAIVFIATSCFAQLPLLKTGDAGVKGRSEELKSDGPHSHVSPISAAGQKITQLHFLYNLCAARRQ